MKKHPILKIISLAVICAAVFLIVINIIPPEKNVENNPFVVAEGELPMIAAHRGGSICNPQNTMLAFREAVISYNVSIIESDLYLTKDGYLVYNHDGYIDTTSNVNGDISLAEAEALCEVEENRHYIKDMTLEELRKYNFGYYFEDENGNRPYKDCENFEELGLGIATVEMLFEEFYESRPDLLFIVEIKNGAELGYTACDKLSEALSEYPIYRNRLVVGTFHDEIEARLKEYYPDLLRGAPTGTAAKFILTQYLGVNLFAPGDFACLQIPTSYNVGITVSLDNANIIDRAHRRNIAVQYWTINDADTMRRLIELGCDCIMTDNPRLLAEVLDEYRD